MKGLKYILHYSLLPLIWGGFMGYFALGATESNELMVAILIGIVVQVAVINAVAQLLVSLIKLPAFQRWFLASGIALIGLWFTFRILHWPGATISMLVGILFFIIFIAILIIQNKKSKKKGRSDQTD
jgi:hypothetical protein